MTMGCLLRLRWQLLCELWMQTASANPSLSTVIFFIATILPWFGGYMLPGIRSVLFTFGPEFWQGVVQYLSQPVLFLLVNIVILSIWLTSGSSGAACYADTDAMKEENQRLMWAVPRESSPRVLPIPRHTTPLASRLSSPPALSLSKISSQYLPVLASKQQDILVCADIAGDSIKEQKPSISKEAKAAAQHQAKLPEAMAGRSVHEKVQAIVNTATRSPTTDMLKSAEEAMKIKVTKRSTTLPQTASRVIVKDLSVDKAIAVDRGLSRKEAVALVLEKDELNERIEAFFARFREQLRQESLRRYQ
ncbi:hypothetical protein O6H91_08G083500 [Diphasiastrum complanatum]|uniref:Uncharacterized protein n=1 Tax=Diphasiastrum complanatum TaxID=34168 RepID=A0ACC2CZI5_DIPCM|nr:hypothetical protein O6H91_08G083500 [Diphasiastrum complanatum]